MAGSRQHMAGSEGQVQLAEEVQGAASFVRALVSDRQYDLDDWLAANRLDMSLAAWLRAQGLAPWTFYRLRRAGLAQCPIDVANTLRADYYTATAYHALLSEALRELLTELDPLGIQPVILKGSVLSNTLYPTPATRPISDLDLLIERSQMPSIREVLRGQGYQDLQGLEPEHHLPYLNHLMVQRSFGDGQVVIIEAHWELLHDPGYARYMNTDQWRSRARPANLGECSALVLEPADQLLHACAHLLLHHGQCPRLIWLLDLRLLVERYGLTWDWAELVQRGAVMHLAATLRYWLAQAEGWFGAFLPEHARRAMAPVVPAKDEARYLAVAQAGEVRVWANYWQHMSGVAGWRDQLRYLRETFFPAWTYMQYRYGARSRWLAPFYYGWRFFRAGLVAFQRSG